MTAPVQQDVCGGLPGPASSACDAATSAGGQLTDMVGDAVGSAASSVIGGMAEAFADAAVHFLAALSDALAATTSVDVSSAWFLERYAVMFGLSALLTLALLLLAVLKAVIRGQGMEAIRSGTVYYLAAVLCSAFAPAVVYLLLKLSDQLCAVLALGGEEDARRFLEGTGAALSGVMTTPMRAAAPAAVLLAAIGTVFCAGILWMELLLRTAIIYVSLLFAAPTFSGLVDRGLWKHSRRWIYFTISVIFAKPVVVAVLALAAAGAGGGGSSDAFTSVFVALALLVVAIFAVGLLFRLVPSAGDEIAGVLSARRELSSATPSSPVPGPGIVVRQSVQSHLVRTASRGFAATPAAPAAAAISAHRIVSGAGRSAAAPATAGRQA